MLFLTRDLGNKISSRKEKKRRVFVLPSGIDSLLFLVLLKGFTFIRSTDTF